MAETKLKTQAIGSSVALTTPNIGVATATSINGNTWTTGTGTLTLAAGKTLTVNKTMTLTSAGDSGVLTLPNVTDTLVGLGTTDVLTNKTLTSPLLQGSLDGWISANEAWSYASATTITVPSGATSKYRQGDYVKWTQTTVKYGIVTAVADTLLTLAANNGYSVANAAISENYYSRGGAPNYFPRYLSYTPTITYVGGTTDPTSNTIDIAYFSLIGDWCFLTLKSTLVIGTGNRQYTEFTLPITRTLTDYYLFNGMDNIGGALSSATNCYTNQTAKMTYQKTMTQSGSYYITGFYSIV